MTINGKNGEGESDFWMQLFISGLLASTRDENWIPIQESPDARDAIRSDFI